MRSFLLALILLLLAVLPVRSQGYYYRAAPPVYPYYYPYGYAAPAPAPAPAVVPYYTPYYYPPRGYSFGVTPYGGFYYYHR